MVQIVKREINGKILHSAQCEYCGKEFTYPYQKQTENNVLSHMKFCKYKPRDAPEPKIEMTAPPAQQPTETEQLKQAEETIMELWFMIEQAQCELQELQEKKMELDDVDMYIPLPYPTQQKKVN